MTKDPEKERARQRAKYLKKKQDPEWLAKRQAYALGYYKKKWASDPEYRAKQLERNRARAAVNREELRARAREYYAEHREERIAYANAYREKHPTARRKSHLHCAYRMTPDEYTAMLVQQNGVCAICEQPETAKHKGKARTLCVDHCHDTGKVRGLLCSDCNRAIGLLKHDLRLLARASSYLGRCPD